MKPLNALREHSLLHDLKRSWGIWLALIVIGYAARAAIWKLTEGCNDIRTWRYFGELVSGGLGQAYVKDGLMNHPPLAALWGAAARQIDTHSTLTFAQAFKIPAVLAEVGTGLLLFSSWRIRGQTATGVRAFAGYSWAISPMLISSFHGNTDAVYFFFVLLAAYMMEGERAPFWAGLALSAALNIKLIPILFALPLATRCQTIKALGRYALGGIVGLAPFVIICLRFSADERAHFIHNVFGYASLPDDWGVELVVRSLSRMTERALPETSNSVREAGNWYLANGGKLMLGLSAIFSLWHLGPGRRRFNAYELCALTFLGFMILASGFGVQYAGCVVAPVFACWVFGGTVAGLSTGIMVGAVYLTFVNTWSPTFSYHDRNVPDLLSSLTMITWLTLIALAYRIAWRRVRTASVRHRSRWIPFLTPGLRLQTKAATELHHGPDAKAS